MNKLSLVLGTFCLSVFICFPAFGADLVDYTDEYFSFSYIQLKNMFIEETITSREGALVFRSDSRVTENDVDYSIVYLTIRDDESYQKSIFVTGEPYSGELEYISDDKSEVNIVSDDHYSWSRDLTSGGTHYQLVFAVYGDCPQEIIDSSKMIYDTFSLGESLSSGYAYDDEFYDHTYIFKDPTYSDKALPYIEQVIRTCDAYLTYSIDGKEALSKLQSIHDSAEEALYDDGYMHDGDAYIPLMFIDNIFENGDDGAVIELKQEYEDMLN